MKKILIILLFISNSIFGQFTKGENSGFEYSTAKWFKAWELISKESYQLDSIKPTEFLFFDEKFIYTTSNISGKDGELIKGPKLFEKKLIWRKKAHNGKFILPDGQERKVGIMAFTYALKEQTAKAFFVMPILNYWIAKKVDDHCIGLEKLTTGVFVHEFCHSQQFENGYNGMEDGAFDKYFSAHENEVFMDDIMQDIYKKDTVYAKEFQNELNLFIAAYKAKTIYEMKIMAKQAIQALEKRQQRILTDDKRDLAEIDNYWLTIEGVAQYSSLMWLVNPKGGKMKIEDALKAEKTASWSQEEGLAIVYLFSKFSPSKNWSKKMFRSKTVNIIELLKKEISYTN
jgi:hypothetical protein